MSIVQMKKLRLRKVKWPRGELGHAGVRLEAIPICLAPHLRLFCTPSCWEMVAVCRANQGQQGYSAVELLLLGKALRSCQVCGSPSITFLRLPGIYPSEGCRWDVREILAGKQECSLAVPLHRASLGGSQPQPWNERDPRLCSLCQDSAHV